MKITSLAENTVHTDYLGSEHGLSLYIETDKNKILFDMGQSSLFSENAEKLSIDLSDVDIAVLSHGHYDHGGGLKKFLEINKKAPVYLSKIAFGDYYNGTDKYIGLDKNLSCSDRLIYTDGTYVIDDSLTLFSCRNRAKNHKHIPSGLNKLSEGEFLPDDFLHEQYLMIEENGKRILISGCSHQGILNIMDWFKPDILVGGFHFSKFSLDDTLKEFAEYLNGFNCEYYTCHCTGAEQFDFMKKYMNSLFYLSTGQNIIIQKEVDLK